MLLPLFLTFQVTLVSTFLIPTVFRSCTIQIIVDFKFFNTSLIVSLYSLSNGLVLDDFSKNSTKYYFPKVYETFQKAVVLEPIENQRVFLTEMAFYTRGGSCHASVIMLSPLASTAKQKALWGILLGMAVTGENPHVIFIEIEETDDTFPAELNGFALTSIYFTFYKDSSSLFLVNNPHGPSENRFHTLSGLETKSYKNLRKEWMDLNRNLRGSKVLFASKYSISASLKTCSYSENQYYTPPYECAVRVLSLKFNYSEYTAYHQYELKEKPFSFFLQGPVKRDINGLLVQHKIFGHNWIVHGVSYEPYQLIVFTTHVGKSFSSVISQVDVWIWVAIILILGILFTFVLAIEGFQSVGMFVGWLVTSLLEQLDDKIARKLFSKKFWMVTPALASWLFSTLILGMFYKGELFSVMIAMGLPPVPQTLRDVVESNLTLVTFSTEGWPTVTNDAVMNDSYLKASIIPDLILDINDTEPFYQFMSKVHDKTQFIRGNAWELALKIVTSFKNGSVNVNNNNGVGVLDSKTNILDLVQSVDHLANEIKPVRNHDLNPFTIRKPWIGKRNYFFVEFARSLGSLVQGGIYYKWEQNFHFKMWIDNINKNYSSGEENQNISSPKFQALTIKDTVSVLFPESRPIELKILKSIFLLHFTLCAICLITLLIEIVYRK